MPEISPLRRLSVAPLALAIAGTALYRGGVDWPVQLAAALLCAAALALAGGRSGRLEVNLLLAGLGLAFAVMLLQLVPLPAPVVRALSPNAADLFARQLGPLGAWPAARPLALDVGGAWRELAKAAACLAAAATGVLLGGARKQRDQLYAAIALCGVAVAGAGYLAALLLLGPLTETHATFVNPNHLAGFLGLTCWLSLGFALRARGQARALWLFGFAVAASGILLSLSRGGIAAFFVGAAVFALLYVRRAQEEAKRKGWLRLAAVPVAVALALAIAAYLALDRVISEMRTVATAAGDTKLQMWPLALEMIRRFPLFGIGKGAFATVFPAFRVEPGDVTFEYLENEWLQAFIDLGLAGGLALLGAFAWSWLAAARRRELSRVEIGALAGMAALAAHSAFDFSLEVLGVALPFSLMAGLLASELPALRLRSGLTRLAPAGLAALAVAGMLVYRAHPTDGDGAAVAAAKDSATALRRAVRDLRWHPADYLAPAAVGIRLVEENHCAAALPWLTRAMARDATYPLPHRYAARCLAAGGKDELAKQEYRLAFLLGDSGALDEAAWRYRTLDEVIDAAPDTPQGLVALGWVLYYDRRPVDAVAVFERAWREYADPGALDGLVLSTWRAGDAQATLERAHDLQRFAPADPRGYEYAGHARAKLGDAKGAQAEWELGASRLPGSPDVLFPLAQLLTAQKSWVEARRALESVVPREPWAAANVRVLMAQLLFAQGRYTEAIDEARSATAARPDDPNLFIILSNYYAQVGRYAEAIDAVTHAAAMANAPKDGYAARLAQLQKARQDQLDRARSQELEAPGGLPAGPRGE